MLFVQTYAERTSNYVGFEAITAVTVNSGVFWVVMPCSSERAQLWGAVFRLNIKTMAERIQLST
jgi:hypothetical protein